MSTRSSAAMSPSSPRLVHDARQNSRPLCLRQAHSPNDQLCREMSLLVGAGRLVTYGDLCRITGIDERRLRRIAAGERQPALDEGLRVAAALGTDTVNTLLATVGYGLARALDTDDEPSPHQLLRQLGESIGTLATALEDGRIDDRERPGLTRDLLSLNSSVATLAAHLQALSGRGG